MMKEVWVGRIVGSTTSTDVKEITNLVVSLSLIRIVAEPTHGISSRNQVVVKE